MSTFAHTALRTFENDLAPLFKGLSFSTFAPIILIAFLGFFLFKLFFGDDFGNNRYGPFSRSIGLTAANLWNSRNHLGLSPDLSGRDLNSIEPVTEILDAISNSIRKYESSAPAPNAYRHRSSQVRFH